MVAQYDEAISYFVDKLGFRLVADIPLPDENKRWVVVSPSSSAASTSEILLAEARSVEEQAAIGNQSGGRVFLFLHTDDFWRDYNAYTERGVEFMESPREEPYGTVAVFKDLYGNQWDLLQPK